MANRCQLEKDVVRAGKDRNPVEQITKYQPGDQSVTSRTDSEAERTKSLA